MSGDPGVDFPTFVADLIEGIFNAIVSASIQQMDAYAELVQSVAESLNDFVDEVAEAGAECLDGLCATREQYDGT
jgi:uroporphyrinogen-III decarboxylase